MVTAPAGPGAHLLELLLTAGATVRVIAPDPSRLQAGVRRSVEVVHGSLTDPAVLAEAFAGADSVWWSVPADPRASDVVRHHLDHARPACRALVEQGVPRVVTLSSLGRAYGRDAGLLTPLFALDDLFEDTGVAYRALRVPYVMDDLLSQVEAIRSDGTVTLPYALDRPLASVALRDVARVAARLLLDRSWTGQQSVKLVGPEVLTPDGMARTMSEVLARPVHARHLPSDAYRAALLEHGTSPAWAQGMVDLVAAQDDGIYEPECGGTTTAAAASSATTSSADGTSGEGTTFGLWCHDVLAPAVRLSRAEEVRAGFAHLRAVDPVLAGLIDKRPDYDADAWRLELPAMDLFGCLVFQVVGQQISVKAASTILARLTHSFADQLPRPEELAQLDEQALRDLGFSWRKARTVLDLAARFADGRLSERRLAGLPDEQILQELTQIPGIGPWTVHGALLIALRRADVVATGDILLANTICRLYGLDHVPTEKEIAELAMPWHPFGSLGVNLLFAAAADLD